MKKLIFIFLSFGIAITGYCQLPNGGFENWTNKGPYEEPNIWESYNTMYPDWGVVVCEKSTDHTEGAYSLKLTSKYSSMVSAVVPGWVMLWGYPYGNRPDTFYFDYKYKRYGTDKGGVIRIFFTRFDTSQNKSITLCDKMMIFQDEVSAWTTATVKLRFNGTSNPDSVFIVFACSDEDYADDSTFMMIDNLRFDASHNSLPNSATTERLQIWPNPAQDFIQYRIPGQKQIKYNLQVINAEGRIVLEKNNLSGNPGSQISLNLTGFAPGIYFLMLKSEETAGVEKFLVR